MPTEDFMRDFFAMPDTKAARTEAVKERRRYALLQAATQIYCMGVAEQVDDWSFKAAVHEAEAMLAAIEKAEAQ